MYSIDEIENAFFRYLNSELSIKDFELWLYSTPQLEGYLGKPAYFDFISFNFQQPNANDELSKLIANYFSATKFCDWKIKRSLRCLLDSRLDPVEGFENLYDMYNKGFHFLEHLAIQYLLGIDEIPKLAAQPLWDQNEFSRRRKLLDSYLHPLKDEIEILLQALESGEIKLLNEKEYFITPGLSHKLQFMFQVFELARNKSAVQTSDITSVPPSQDMSREPFGTPVSKPEAEVRQLGKITYNEKWNLTPRIKNLLEELAKAGVDIYASRGESDYTFLVPPYLSREEYEHVERLMNEVGKAVKRKVNYIDWYPHGTKFRID